MRTYGDEFGMNIAACSTNLNETPTRFCSMESVRNNELRRIYILRSLGYTSSLNSASSGPWSTGGLAQSCSLEASL